MRRWTLTLTLVLFAAFPPRSATADTFTAPDTVYAGPDGWFSYQWVFVAEPDSILVAGSGWYEVANTSPGFHGDCFCVPEFCTIQPGVPEVWNVNGRLLDDQLPGTVANWIAFCPDPDMGSFTTIMPYDPTPARATSWGRVKALYP